MKLSPLSSATIAYAKHPLRPGLQSLNLKGQVCGFIPECRASGLRLVFGKTPSHVAVFIWGIATVTPSGKNNRGQG